ncbi:RND-type multidrug efflux pump, outer membrane protein [Novosphingobium nitrogenifigens DSM 19370]|uniref:RND-type multidrug efflux pump, outer membrane protein n=1 Tax=Novosphingobium nitrogenifigens DSM 19370 TaxID=983920 RepID=F1Z9P4_9SPHN|nr:RND-type multidrug efflux pump, outer membrane protein [Novosphingobium nitrogenifigens DSM 19370]
MVCPALVVGLDGCVRVPPAPIDLPSRAAARTDAPLDRAEVDRRAALLAPDVPHPTDGLDRLALLAAIMVQDPRVEAARAALEGARRDARLAHKAASPTLTLSSEYANDPTTSSPWLIGGAFDLPLDYGGRREGRIRGAELGVVGARYDLAETVWSERVAAQRALIDVLAGERQVALGTALVGMIDRQIAAMDRRAAAGEIAPLDLAPVRAQRAAAARALDDAHARVRGGRAAIAGVLGVPVSALDGIGFIWPDFDQSPMIAAVEREDVRAALPHRADILRTMVAYDQAEAALQVEIAKQVPTVSLGPGYTWERGLVKWPVNVNLQMPSFDFNRSAIAAAQAHRATAGQAVEAALANAQAAIETAASERRAAALAYARIMREEVPQARLAADRADDRLRLGAIGRADWAALKSGDIAARLAAIDALTRLRQAQIALEDSLRRPLDGPETHVAAATLWGNRP